MRYHVNTNISRLPRSLFIGKKEGDVIDIRIPVKISDLDEEDPACAVDAILAMHLTLQQKGYRYSNFGTFEDVLSEVCQSYPLTE